MSMQDPIADMFVRIRNAQARAKRETRIPTSKKKLAIAEVLKNEGYIQDFHVEGEGVSSMIVVELKYFGGRPVIEKISRVSRPGLRSYKGSEKLPKVVGGLGIAIVSTSRGLMTDRQARSLGIGGEVICSVY
jgi:small subunit ribosomal protein S8